MHVEIPTGAELEERVFRIHNDEDFQQIALAVYLFQFYNNSLYQQWCTALGRTPERVKALHDIPFLPISFFKTHRVAAFEGEAKVVFRSSGTTGAQTSRHEVASTSLYEKSFLEGFNRFYGAPEDWCILGLLPSYLERKGSSLVYMVDVLIRQSAHPDSGFYLDEVQKLATLLQKLERENQKTLLIGVSFALLDFARDFSLRLNNTVVMETGGMKGRGRELTRTELYEILQRGLGVKEVHSEYGMTELLSQAYAKGGRFHAPPWMKVFLRDETDPLSLYTAASSPRSGGINVVDLANIYSCSFIATEDVGRLHGDGSFEVLGRMDHTDIRGCSLLVAG